MTDKKNEVLDYTREIVSAYVSNTKLSSNEIVPLIESVYSTLNRLNETEMQKQLGSATIEKVSQKFSNVHLRPTNKPAVPIENSIHPDYVICLEDGRKLKTLRRHLKSAFNLTPESYRARWGLPEDYPMVAPNYSKKRRELATQIGLGRNRGNT